MKNVISVDTILNRIVSQEAITEGGWAEYTLKEEDIKYGNPLHNQAELKKDLHSLLISKLPEKRPTIGQFRGTDLKYDAGAFDGYNKCLDDMHRVIDEMFEVHNEK